MQRTPVSSSHLASVGYDLSSGTLEIEFISGQIYQYFNVPEPIHSGLMSARSRSSYFDENIGNGGYDFVRIR